MNKKYRPGDMIEVRHKNSDTGVCLVLNAKKRYNFYELEVLSRGKTFTIVDDGSFYNISIIERAKDEKRITE